MDFGLLLGLAYEQFVVELHEHFTRAGFPELAGKSSYGYVLRTLNEGGMTATKLGEGLGITPQGAAKLIDEMVAAGLVERRPDPQDRRAKLLFLSEAGQNALAEARAFHAKFERALVGEVGQAQVSAVRSTLETIAMRSDVSDLARLFRPF